MRRLRRLRKVTTPPTAETQQGGSGTAHLDPNQLQDMTVAELKKLAADMGIETKQLKTKDELVEAICAGDVVPGDEHRRPRSCLLRCPPHEQLQDAVQEDLNSVFLNPDEFAETHTVYYDGEEYSDIPIVMTGLSEKERVRQSISDHAEGIYRVSRVLHCDIAAIGGKQPEQGLQTGH